MIDWSKVDWLDVGLHVLVAAVVMNIAMFMGQLAWEWTFAIAVVVIFWLREAAQRTPPQPRPWKWGWGSQIEFYAPASLVVLWAIASTIWAII